MGLTSRDYLEIIGSIKEAIKRAAINGGVSEYTVKSSQGETRVKQADIAQLTEQLVKYQALYNEMVEIESGSNFSITTGFGL